MNYNKSRKPNEVEIKELRQFQYNVYFDMGMDEAEFYQEVDELFSNALITVFDPAKDSGQDKMMMTVWENNRGMYLLYTWVNGTLKSIVQDGDLIQNNNQPEDEWTVT
jgi:hypothetical protein